MCADDPVSLCADDSFAMCAGDPLSMCADDPFTLGVGRMVGTQLGWRGVLTCADAPEVKLENKEEVACIIMHHENHDYTASADSVLRRGLWPQQTQR